MNIGDIIELGSHRLMCGDAQNKDNVNELLSGVKPNLLLTDPPYGISIVNCGGGQIGGQGGTELRPFKHTHTHTKWHNWRSKTSKFQEERWEFQQDQDFTERERVIGKVGKPRHCRTKTLQTSNR